MIFLLRAYLRVLFQACQYQTHSYSVTCHSEPCPELSPGCAILESQIRATEIFRPDPEINSGRRYLIEGTIYGER
jgi:hypothetical protein